MEGLFFLRRRETRSVHRVFQSLLKNHQDNVENSVILVNGKVIPGLVRCIRLCWADSCSANADRAAGGAIGSDRMGRGAVLREKKEDTDRRRA